LSQFPAKFRMLICKVHVRTLPPLFRNTNPTISTCAKPVRISSNRDTKPSKFPGTQQNEILPRRKSDILHTAGYILLSPSTDIRENHQRATVILAHLSTLQCTDHLNNHPHQRSILPSHFSYIDRRVCHPILCLYHSLSLIQFRNVNILSQIFIRREHDMYHGSTTFTHISQIHS
jgi:hypothetical protein